MSYVFDLSSLSVLHNLHSLFITTERTAVLDEVRKHVKIDQLKEFSIDILDDNWDANVWNNFAKYLVENTKLHKLKMNGCIHIDKKTFSILNLFNLNSLWLDVYFSWYDFSRASHGSAMTSLKYLRLEWSISWCKSEKIGHILDMLPTVEAICFNVHDGSSDLLIHFKDEFYSDILKRSDNRPGFRMHIFSSEVLLLLNSGVSPVSGLTRT